MYSLTLSLQYTVTESQYWLVINIKHRAHNCGHKKMQLRTVCDKCF